jgi:hypothetical protein
MSIPWGAILDIVIKITLYILSKNASTIEAKKKFYEFISHVDSTIPIKLNRMHKVQLEEVKRELERRKREEQRQEQTLATYKEEYEKLTLQ